MVKKTILVVLSLVLIPSFTEAGLFAGPDISYSFPVWSKDGSRIFYIKKVDHFKSTFLNFSSGPGEYIAKQECYIMSMRPDGSDKKVIIKFITEEENHLPDIYNLLILPDGKQLIFFLLGKHEKLERCICKVNIDGTNLVKLLDFGEITRIPDLFVSPDGTKIAYTKERYGDENKDIIGSVFSSWLMDADGQNNYMVCGEASEVKGWTTNGYLIISTYADSEGDAKLKYGNKAHTTYPEDVMDRTLIYDPTSKKLIKNIPHY